MNDHFIAPQVLITNLESKKVCLLRSSGLSFILDVVRSKPKQKRSNTRFLLIFNFYVVNVAWFMVCLNNMTIFVYNYIYVY